MNGVKVVFGRTTRVPCYLMSNAIAADHCESVEEEEGLPGLTELRILAK